MFATICIIKGSKFIHCAPTIEKQLLTSEDIVAKYAQKSTTKSSQTWNKSESNSFPIHLQQAASSRAEDDFLVHPTLDHKVNMNHLTRKAQKKHVDSCKKNESLP